MWLRVYMLQFKKIYTSRQLVVFMFLIYIAFFVLLAFSPRFMPQLEIIKQAKIPNDEFFKFPLVFATSAWIASFFVIFWAVFFILFLWQDLRGNSFVANSYFKHFLMGKLSFMLTVPVDWTLTSVLGALLLGMHWGHSAVVESFFPMQVLLLMFQVLGFLSLAFLCAVVARSATQAIVYFIGYFVVEAFVRKAILQAGGVWAHFLPAKIFTRMVLPPSVDFLSKYALNDYLSNNPFPWEINLVAALLWSILFIIVAIKILKNKTYGYEN